MRDLPCSVARPILFLVAPALVLSGALSRSATAQDAPLRRVHQMVHPVLAYGGVAGDWDGDGDLDLTGSAMWFENVDHGRFELQAFTGPFYFRPILGADFGLDGATDLVSTIGYPSSLSILENAGGAPFSSPAVTLVYPAGSNGFGKATAADFDGDGDIDLYAFGGRGHRGTPDVLFFNDGLGSFPMQSPGATSTNEAWNVQLADFDGDGDVDLLRGDGSITELWSNDGLGALQRSPVQPAIPSGTTSLFTRAGDLDADGNPDFLIGNPPRAFRNHGEARFSDEGAVLPALYSYSEQSFHLADLDGNDLPDVLGVPASASVSLLFRNTGGTRFEEDNRSPLPLNTYVVADVDGDRDRDVIGASAGAFGEVELWLNDSRGRFLNTRDPWESGVRADEVALGDLDGDGFADVLSWEDKRTYQGPWPAILYRNLQDGTFSEERLSLSLAGYPLLTSLGDVDLDGDLDVYTLASTFNGRTPELIENDGSGGLTLTSGRFPNASTTYSSPLGDLDLDGDPDLVTIDLSYGPNAPLLQAHSWLDDGSGRFVDSGKLLPSAASYGGNVVLGDIDGDSDLDAWILVSGLLWSNDGSGGFADITPTTTSTLRGDAGAFADMDGDGDVDIVSKSTICFDGDCSGWGAVLLNDGLGTFTTAMGYWNSFDPSFGSGAITVVDVDSDGDADVMNSNCSLWENDGTGRLEDESYELLDFCLGAYGGYYGLYYAALAVGDLDLDGDHDYWYPQLPRPAAGIVRHVSWRSYPRAGKPLTMEVFGPAGTAFQLFSSTGFTEPQVTDMGFLRLATRGARLVATGTLDADGKAAVTLGVPSDIALPEHTVYWQALVGSPPRLTNLELTTFRDL